jgi:uncharacterized membrane protein YeaQ/YmgE (transglycosylase-associated protein family)
MNMNFIIWIVIGGIIGWLASLVMKTDAQQGMFLNVVVGIVGALLGGWLLSPLFGTGTINSDDFSVMSLVVSFLGAVILLAIVTLVCRGRARAAPPRHSPKPTDSRGGFFSYNMVRRTNPAWKRFQVDESKCGADTSKRLNHRYPNQ